MKVHYTIVDGEHEYANSFFMRSDGSNEEGAKLTRNSLRCTRMMRRKSVKSWPTFKTDGMAMIGCRAIKDVTVMELDEVTVFVRGGVIQDIQNIPAGVRIRVQDYDVDNLTEQELR